MKDGFCTSMTMIPVKPLSKPSGFQQDLREAVMMVSHLTRELPMGSIRFQILISEPGMQEMWSYTLHGSSGIGTTQERCALSKARAVPAFWLRQGSDNANQDVLDIVVGPLVQTPFENKNLSRKSLK